MFSKDNVSKIPYELIDYIILFADDSKKIHKSKLFEVCNDITRMSEIMECDRYHLSPRIAKMCWGSQAESLPSIDEIFEGEIDFTEMFDLLPLELI